jgi:hypothetical protein
MVHVTQAPRLVVLPCTTPPPFTPLSIGEGGALQLVVQGATRPGAAADGRLQPGTPLGLPGFNVRLEDERGLPLPLQPHLRSVVLQQGVVEGGAAALHSWTLGQPVVRLQWCAIMSWVGVIGCAVVGEAGRNAKRRAEQFGHAAVSWVMGW